MKFLSRLTHVSCILFLAAPAHTTRADEDISPRDAHLLFVNTIWPTLSESCLACHGDDPEKIKGGLDLNSRESALKGGDYGPAFIPGEPNSSQLLEAIRWENEDLQMPPKESERLEPSVIEVFEKWIAAGAPWPNQAEREQLITEQEATSNSQGLVRAKTSGGLKDQWTNRRYQREDLWAFQPLTIPEVPTHAEHPIDSFVAEKLQALKLEPAPLADRRTLIRRATFDLLGLPPTPTEVANFLSDERPLKVAFAQVVERLLNSPHYGEQWGRHWLDVVRYADTAGFANDFDRGNAWRYRDYVVRSFNNDKPYPQFVREQIAGDELDPTNPENLVSVGFLRMGPWELTPMEVPAIARQRFLDDVVNSVGQTFLGQTLRCAKCHDHKFDPIPTRDYYSLYTTFNTTQLTEREATFLPEENQSGFEERRYLLEQKTQTQAKLKALQEKTGTAIRRWFAERELPYKTRQEAQRAGLSAEEIPPKGYGFTVEDFGLERITRKTLSRLTWKLERYEPVAYSVYSGKSPKRNRYTEPHRTPDKPMKQGILEEGHILTGGDAFSPAALVEPAALSVLNHSVPELAEVSFPKGIQGRRTALAHWITRANNPLTYRSIANRIWQWHFGQALAGNPNNLGASGKKPSHPELLDWLANEFRHNDGSFKAMHRLIMASDTYQRASQHPDLERLNELDSDQSSYAVFQPRRLRSEELRDSMLMVSGELNQQLGGIPNRPEINLEVALQPRMVMGTFATAWQPNPRPSERHRRSLYALKVRGLRDPFMEVFNEPDPDLSCENRDASNVTPQVFSLFNSQIAYDRAVAFALRLNRETNSLPEAIDHAFQLAFNRPATASEQQACREHYQLMREQHASKTIPKPEYPTDVLREAVEENTGEKFSFREHLNVFEDFEPDPKLADVSPETRALAEICLVLLNSNEFVYVY